MIHVIFYLIQQFIYASIVTFGFSILSNAPKKERFHCTLTGALAWLSYSIVWLITEDSVVSTLFGAISVAFFSRLFSFTRQMPSTVFLIQGIIPLVPGSTIYRTMTSILANDLYASYEWAVKTFKLAGVITVGLIIVFTLPYGFFSFIHYKKSK